MNKTVQKMALVWEPQGNKLEDDKHKWQLLRKLQFSKKY